MAGVKNQERMRRREFLKTTGTIVAGGAVSKNVLAEAFSSGNAGESGRLVLAINRNWRYRSDVPAGFEAREFDDSQFERVVIPHTNKRLPWHSFDEKSYEFISAYRRRFKVPPQAKGKHVFVEFEGAMTASTVWINGQKLGEYKGGYTPFSFELTPHLDWDGENVLAVAVDSTERADIPPFGYEIDYLTFGGIYREVWLRIVPGTFIENIFARPENVPTAPTLRVDCFVQHIEASRQPLTLEVELRDGGNVIARNSARVAPSPRAAEPSAYAVQLQNLSGVKLWGLANPVLYQVRVRLLQGATVLDAAPR